MTKNSKLIIVLCLLLGLSFIIAPISDVYATKTSGQMEVMANKLKLNVKKKPGTVKRGSYARVVIKTVKKAKCSIAVYYKSGKSKAKGLNGKKANNKGLVQWKWEVGTNTTPGKYRITIKAKKKSRVGTKTIKFRVVKK